MAVRRGTEIDELDVDVAEAGQHGVGRARASSGASASTERRDRVRHVLGADRPRRRRSRVPPSGPRIVDGDPGRRSRSRRARRCARRRAAARGCRRGPSPSSSRALPAARRAALTCAGVGRGRDALYSAAAPVTCGAAIEVPRRVAVAGSRQRRPDALAGRDEVDVARRSSRSWRTCRPCRRCPTSSTPLPPTAARAAVAVGERRDRDHLVVAGRDEARGVEAVVAGGGDHRDARRDEPADRLVHRRPCW